MKRAILPVTLEWLSDRISLPGDIRIVGVIRDGLMERVLFKLEGDDLSEDCIFHEEDCLVHIGEVDIRHISRRIKKRDIYG